MTAYQILVDDYDEDKRDDDPWSARLLDESGSVIGVGYGSLPADAIADALDEGLFVDDESAIQFQNGY